MNEETAKRLREPFPADSIEKLPRITCPACSKKQCNQHQRQKCNVCNAYISTQHIHLDYVGHAAVTDRLLQADPEWTWEPVAFGPDGLPKMDGQGGLWMRLTIDGVTRLGYGDAAGKTGPNAVKEAIGDGIRNAAMRFGVALDLWAKGDLASQRADNEQADDQARDIRPAQASGPPADQTPPADLTPKQALWRYAQGLKWSASRMDEEFTKWSGGAQLKSAVDDQVQAFLIDLRSEAQAA
jgi:hypothetical protein